MSRFWSPVVRDLKPYVPGEQPTLNNLVKLNTNEHPFGPSPRALAAIRAETSDSLRLYPDPNAERLKKALGMRFGVDATRIFVGNGSDEVLAHIFLALLRHDRPLWFPDITYSFYPVYCGLYGITYETIALDADYRIDPLDYLPRGERAAGGIIFANPNAPTGCFMPLVDVERIVSGNPDCVVVVDEAYVDFGGESAVRLTDRYPNLLIVHTFSKSRSLAGLRVGYAIGNSELIEALERVKNSFNSYPLDRLAIAGAVASVEDEEHFRENCSKVIALREALLSNLSRLGFDVLPSAANFIFARHQGLDAVALAASLRERAIIVRHFAKPRIDQFLRITVGTAEQCDKLISTLRDILGSRG